MYCYSQWAPTQVASYHDIRHCGAVVETSLRFLRLYIHRSRELAKLILHRRDGIATGREGGVGFELLRLVYWDGRRV